MSRSFPGWLVAAGLALALGGFAVAADALYYGVIKSHQFEQAPGRSPQLLATNAFAFNAVVLCATNHAVTNATVKVPDASGTVRTLNSESNGIALLYEARFQSQAALDAAYPSSGSFFNPSVYTFTMQTVHDGTPNPKVSYWLSSLPNTPTVTNLNEAQAIDATRDFALRWEPFNGTFADIVQVLVTDTASNMWYNSPVPFATGALNGNSNSVIIPAGQLPAGQALVGHLLIARPGLPNTNSYAGAFGVAAHLKDTAFPLATLPAVPPTLVALAPSAAGFQLGFIGESNRTYHLLASTNPALAPSSPTAWQRLFTTNSPTGRGSVTDTQAVQFPQRFYRLEVGP